MKYVLRIDDVCEFIDIDKFNEFISFCKSQNITGFLGFIPDCKDPKLMSYGKYNKINEIVKDLVTIGWEVSLHGYTHFYNQKGGGFMNSSKSEFIGLGKDIQYEMIKKGMRILNKIGFKKVESFFAPSHGYDINTIAALKENGIKLLLDGYNPAFSSFYGINSISCIVDLPPNNIKLINTYHILCVHTNTFNESSLERYKRFIIKNKNHFISPNNISIIKNNDNFIFRIIESIIYLTKKIKRNVWNIWNIFK